ncbi:hypothetical protein ES703_58511 [subsurface metagenome]
MAICKYGPLVSEVRGSIGGTTFTAGRFGNVVRQRRSPIHAPTVRRHEYKSLFASVIGQWSTVLDQPLRDAWDTLASNTDFVNSLGETYHPTGLNLYVRTNVLMGKLSLGRQITAPPEAVGTHMGLEYQYTETFAFEARRTEAPSPMHNVAFWLSLPQSPPTKFYVGPWIQFAQVNTDDLAIWQEIFPATVLVAGQRYFIRDRGVYTAGQVTAPYIQTILAVEL